MRQLGELKKNADKFEQAGAEVIAVFREEKKGVEGLGLIKKKSGVEFTLALDNGKAKTKRYSPGKREFSSYVVGKDGIIKEVITGDLRTRAKSKQLLSAIRSLSDPKSASKPDGK